MPSFEVSLKNLEKLTKRNFEESDLEYAKAELDGKEGDTLKIKSSDTNRPDLWSEEGIARIIRGIHGISKGMPKLLAKKGSKKIIVNSSVSDVRPFISGFVVSSMRVTDASLRSMINMQESLSENYGRKRQNIAIGIYSCEKINFPIRYEAVEPDSVKFVPLGLSEKISLREILQKHPTGIKYADLLKGINRYPLLTDAKHNVLSFPPVINSNDLGKVEPGEASLFVEVTGKDQRHVMIVANIIAQAFYDSGAKLEIVTTSYPDKTLLGKDVPSPLQLNQKLSFKISEVESLLGTKLSKDEILKYLGSMQYEASFAKGLISVVVPCYRGDIMHTVDVIEDIAIAHGYNKFAPLEIKSFTAGKLDGTTTAINRIRRIMAGLGFQETISPILSSRSASERMNLKEGVLELENPMSETYSTVRSSILPSIMQCLNKNKHVEYPQKVFEIGECAIKLMAKDTIKFAGCITDSRVSYEDIASVMGALLRSLGLEYKTHPVSDPRFIEGRSALISVGGDRIGVMGELNPQVLNNWELENPVAAFEINADKIMKKPK